MANWALMLVGEETLFTVPNVVAPQENLFCVKPEFDVKGIISCPGLYLLKNLILWFVFLIIFFF